MKLGLICKESTRKLITDSLDHLGITFYKSPDIYLVEKGLEETYIPCIVFSSDNIEKLIEVVKKIRPQTQTNKLIGLREDTFHIIHAQDVLYFEAMSSAVLCHTIDGTFNMKEKLYEVEERLPREAFIRISRSFIVNINKVSTIAPWFNRRLILTFESSEQTVEVSKNYVNAFKAFLGMR